MNQYNTERILKRMREEMQGIRNYKGLSQKEMGDILGVTGQQVAKYESGENQIKVSTLISFCQFFNINIEDFLKRCTEGGEIEKLYKTGQLNQETINSLNIPDEDYTEYKM